jgi:hypothetical protein
METEMTKISKAKLIQLGSAKRLTRGGNRGPGEALVFKQIVG